jgi:hypothetical protein
VSEPDIHEVFLQECIAETRSGEHVVIQARWPRLRVLRMLVELGATEEDLERIEVERL